MPYANLCQFVGECRRNIAGNYDVYVPKSTYSGSTGLFKTVNNYIGKNTQHWRILI